MSHLKNFIVMLAVMALCGNNFADDPIQNGSFETNELSDWTVPSAPAGIEGITIGAPNEGADSGMSAAEFRVTNGVVELRQSFAANPGDEFKLTGSILTESTLAFPPDVGLGLLKIVFRDADGNDLVPASASSGVLQSGDNPGIDSAPAVDFNAPLNTWVTSTAQGVAPAETAEVLFLALNISFPSESVIWFDSLSACNTVDNNELLANGDFDTGDLTGWTGNDDGPADPEGVTFGVPGVGAFSGKTAARLALGDGVAELRQSFPAGPGEEFSLTGYMLTENSLPGGVTFGLLKIVFKDENGNDLQVSEASRGSILSGQNPGIESNPFLNNSSMPNEWVFTEAQGIAPADTAEVVFLVLNVDFGNGENPMWFDAISAFNVGNNMQLLTNGDFETGDFSGWTDDGGNEGGDAPAGVTLGAPMSGALDGSVSARFALAEGVSELRQSFTANPGDEFYMSGFMLTESMLPPTDSGATFGLVKIVFRNEAGEDLVPESSSIGFLNSDNPGIDSTPLLNGDSPVDSWVFTEARGVAPAETTEVLFLLLNVDFGNGENPMWFDDITVSQVNGCIPGDVDCSGSVTLLDIAPFVDLLTSPVSRYQCEGDVNGDNVISLLDVAPFVDAINASGG